MLKQKDRKIRLKPLLGAIFSAVVLTGMTFHIVGQVRADQFDEQIKSLQQQNDSNQSQSDQLGAQAAGFQDQIDKLQAQINSLQTAIVDNQNKSDQLQKQIDAEEQELARQKKFLGEDIKQMYLDGQVTTLELLASSNNLGEFIDKEQYRNSVQNKIQTTVDQINDLKAKLVSQQKELQALIADEKNQQSQVAAAQAQQNQLLSATESQKSSLDAAIKSNQSQIAALRLQQLAANRRLGGSAVPGDPGHGNYPGYLDNAAQDSIIDPWGMWNRECVSYTAWKVQQFYGNMPYWGGVGNANQWPSDAARYGIPTGSVPKVHSVAISMAGGYGHAMWVEAVNGNTIYVSQYNYDLAGHYSEMSLNGSGLIYIYFGDRH